MAFPYPYPKEGTPASSPTLEKRDIRRRGLALMPSVIHRGFFLKFHEYEPAGHLSMQEEKTGNA